MDDWTVTEVRRIVDALRLSLEAAPAGNAWVVRTISAELKYWMDLERRLSRNGGIRAAPALDMGSGRDHNDE